VNGSTIRTSTAWGLGVLWALLAAVCLFAWHLWGAHGLPVGSFWWDELALSGGALAVQQGMRPGIDFWSPFVLPHYVKWLAHALGGMGRGYLIECMLQGGIVLVLFSMVVAGRRQPSRIYMLGALAVISAMFPFNLGSVTQAAPGAVSFCGSYNRLGASLLMLVFLLPSVRRDVGSAWRDAIWLALVLFLALLLKITVAQLALVFLVLLAALVPQAGWRIVVVRALLLVMLACAALWLLTGIGPGYASALGDIAKVRSHFLAEKHQRMIDFFLSDHYLELFVLSFMGVLYIVKSVLSQRPWLTTIALYACACLGVTLYTLTNFGDNGLLPATAAIGLLWRAQRPQVSLSALDAEPAPSRQRYARLLNHSLLAMFWAGALAHVSLNLHWANQLRLHQQPDRLVPIPVAPAFFTTNFVVNTRDWDVRPNISVRYSAFSVRAPGAYVAYVDGLEDVHRYVLDRFPDKATSVYALDYPAYIFALTDGYRIPKGSYPWLLYGHELDRMTHPPAQSLLADVDVLLTSKCSLATLNRRQLSALYAADIARDWVLARSFRCWDVHVRKGVQSEQTAKMGR